MLVIYCVISLFFYIKFLLPFNRRIFGDIMIVDVWMSRLWRKIRPCCYLSPSSGLMSATLLMIRRIGRRKAPVCKAFCFICLHFLLYIAYIFAYSTSV